jgi:hypothetical protein
MAGEGNAADCRRRKKMSDAEKVALDLYKFTSKQIRQSRLRLDGQRKLLDISKIGNAVTGNECRWTNPGHPIYCSHIEFRFETNLPEREYLTRYRISCPRCDPSQKSSYQLYCSYCDEILGGSIAGPGGKIADHIVTIRHVVKEAIMQNDYLDMHGFHCAEEFKRTEVYVSKLTLWASKIRFKRNADERQDLERTLHSLKHKLLLGARGQISCAAVIHSLSPRFFGFSSLLVIRTLTSTCPACQDLSNTPPLPFIPFSTLSTLQSQA